MAFQAITFLAVVIASAGFSDAAYTPAPGWPKDANDKALPCAHSTKVLEDKASGWPAKCMNLAQVQDAKITNFTAAQCSAACVKNPQCEAWQLTPVGYCWVSIPGNRGTNCWGGEGRVSSFSAGQRIQRGLIKQVKSLSGWWVATTGDKLTGNYLKNIGVMGSSDAQKNRERCRDQCYSDISCRYWQYGGAGANSGCWLEAAPSYVVPDPAPMTQDSDDARTNAFGEQIDHICPAPPEVAAKKKSSLMLILGIIGGVVLGLILLAVLYFALCRGTDPKPKKTRAVKISQKKPAEQPLAMAPMPLLAPTYTTYAAPSPTYQIVATSPPVASIVAPAPVQYAPAPVGSVVMQPVVTAPVAETVVIG